MLYFSYSPMFFTIFRDEILAKKVFFGLFIFAIIIFPTVSAASKLRPSYDVLYSTWNEFYVPPWMRIIPYLIGTVGGFLNFKLKNKLNLSDVSKGLPLGFTNSKLKSIYTYFGRKNAVGCGSLRRLQL